MGKLTEKIMNSREILKTGTNSSVRTITRTEGLIIMRIAISRALRRVDARTRLKKRAQSLAYRFENEMRVALLQVGTTALYLRA